jgi:hypothetical protein
MKAKEDRLGEEGAELTNLLKCTVLHPEQANVSEIIKRILPESKQFPLLMKKGKGRVGSRTGDYDGVGLKADSHQRTDVDKCRSRVRFR